MHSVRKYVRVIAMKSRYKYAVEAAGVREGDLVLDVGCRDMVLAQYLPPGVGYCGLDVQPVWADRAQKVIIHNLDKGLTVCFDNYYDVVFALDVLEHTDNFHNVLTECLRVCKRTLVVTLPNMAHVKYSLSWLLRGRMSAKYDLADTPPPDRHKWLTSVYQTDALMRHYNAEVIRIYDGRKLQLISWVGRLLRLPIHLYVHTTIYVIQKGVSND